MAIEIDNNKTEFKEKWEGKMRSENQVYINAFNKLSINQRKTNFMCCKKRIPKTLFCIAKAPTFSRLRRALARSACVVKLRYIFFY